jgi:hypothetical protein
VDRALRLAVGDRGDGGRAEDRGEAALGALEGVALEGAAGRAGQRGVLGLGQLVEDMGRNDGAEDGLEAPVSRHDRHPCTA